MHSELNRRDFLKIAGAAAGVATMAACGGKAGNTISDLDPLGHHTDEVPTDKMTYRTNPNTGDKVSILGYGMMRLPNIKVTNTVNGKEVEEEEIDQQQDRKSVV